MKSFLQLRFLTPLAAAVITLALAEDVQAQIPVVTYYSQPVNVFSPVVPPTVVYRPAPVYTVPATTVYSVPTTPIYSVPTTTVYSVPTTTMYSAPAPAIIQAPTATVVYDNGPLGLGLFPRRRVLYSPSYVVAPATPLAFPTTGVVYGGP